MYPNCILALEKSIRTFTVGGLKRYMTVSQVNMGELELKKRSQ